MKNNQINEHLTSIAQHLYEKSKTVNNIGLLDGATGIALFFFLYSRYFNDIKYESYAHEMIDNIGEKITEAEHTEYAGGLAGFGTCIEFLAKHQFIDVNTNEILEDMDQYLQCKLPIFFGNPDLNNGIGGIVKYFIMRQSKMAENGIKVLSHVSDMFGSKSIGSYQSAISLIDIYSSLLRLNINMSKSEKYINYAIDKIETMIYEDIHFKLLSGLFNPLSLAYKLFKVAEETKNDKYNEKSMFFLNSYEMNFREYLTYKQVGVIAGPLKWSFLYKFLGTKLQNQNYLEESKMWLSKYFSDCSLNEENDIPFSILNGIAGDGILLLSLMENTYESAFEIIPIYYEKAANVRQYAI
jgi:Lanthionine synthetase C-like protein.